MGGGETMCMYVVEKESMQQYSTRSTYVSQVGTNTDGIFELPPL
jgi:hypothetical protein